MRLTSSMMVSLLFALILLLTRPFKQYANNILSIVANLALALFFYVASLMKQFQEFEDALLEMTNSEAETDTRLSGIFGMSSTFVLSIILLILIAVASNGINSSRSCSVLCGSVQLTISALLK